INESHSVATHGTASLHGYGSRLCLWTVSLPLQPPMELRLRMGPPDSYRYPWNCIFAWVSSVDSKKMGRIDKFWSEVSPEFRHDNISITAEIGFLSRKLSCDGEQLDGEQLDGGQLDETSNTNKLEKLVSDDNLQPV
ncbi:12598_t:CDS:2, partial [Racocetra persica]